MIINAWSQSEHIKRLSMRPLITDYHTWLTHDYIKRVSLWYTMIILFFKQFQESETLVSQNHHLKSEIHKLEREKKRLIDVLSAHETSCPKRLKTASAANQLNNYDMLVGDLPTTVGYSQPQKDEAPLYSNSLSYSPLPSIKVEDMSSPVDDDIFLRPQEPLGYYDGSLFQTHRNHLAHVPHHFLGVKTLGHTYLDLDSRCIAL